MYRYISPNIIYISSNLNAPQQHYQTVKQLLFRHVRLERNPTRSYQLQAGSRVQVGSIWVLPMFGTSWDMFVFSKVSYQLESAKLLFFFKIRTCHFWPDRLNAYLGAIVTNWQRARVQKALSSFWAVRPLESGFKRCLKVMKHTLR